MPRALTTPARLAFVLYAALLATLTHWPRLAVDGPVPRSDLYIHLAAFALWTILLALTGWTGNPARRAGTVRLLAVAGAYALLDELTQGLPGLGRVVALDDALANLVGVGVGAAAAALVARFLPARRRNRVPPDQ